MKRMKITVGILIVLTTLAFWLILFKGGGAGYIGGVPSLSYSGSTYGNGTTNGSRSGNGQAIITFVKRAQLPIVYNDSTLEKIIFNGTKITSLIYNGTKLFFERMKARFRTWSSWMKQAAYF